MGANWLSATQSGIGLASSLSSIASAKKQYKIFSNYQDLQIKAINDNYAQGVNALNQQYNEAKEASSTNLMNSYISNLQKKASAQASAASSGVTGNSIEGLFRGYDRANAVNRYTAARNLQLKGLQTDRNIDSLRAQALSSIQGMQQYSYQSADTSGLFSSLFDMLGDLNSLTGSSAKESLVFNNETIDLPKVYTDYRSA